MATIKHVLLATDLTDASEPAFDEALSIAQALHAKLTILHIYFLPIYLLPDAVYVPTAEQAERVTENAQAGLEALAVRARAKGLVVDADLTSGDDPCNTILEHAKQRGADLVILGTHGRGAIKTALLGSVAQEVVRHADIPILTVRGAA
jgi:nucleotide-binding universal stress UspA family protein